MELFDLGIDDEKKTPDTQIILGETIIDKSQQHDTKLITILPYYSLHEARVFQASSHFKNVIIKN